MEGIAPMVMLYTGEMFTVQKTLSHAVPEIRFFFFLPGYKQPCILLHLKNTRGKNEAKITGNIH